MTLECAGNGRALTSPRAASQPWLLEAVGTAEWTGTPLAPILEEAGLHADATEVVFTGLDRGIQGEVEHDYARSLQLDEALRDEVCSPTRSTAGRSRRSTAFRFASSFPAGTA